MATGSWSLTERNSNTRESRSRNGTEIAQDRGLDGEIPRHLSFQRMINDRRFSDIKVLVGPEERAFNLHRNFLAHHSEFFNRVLDPQWREAQDRIVRLPEISVSAFRAVVNWIYGGAFPVLPHRNCLGEIYRAADFLQISEFKNCFFSQLLAAVKIGHQTNRRPVRHCSIPGPFILLGKLLAIAPEADHPFLQKLADTLVLYFDIPWDEMCPLIILEPDESTDTAACFYMLALALDNARNPHMHTLFGAGPRTTTTSNALVRVTRN